MQMAPTNAVEITQEIANRTVAIGVTRIAVVTLRDHTDLDPTRFGVKVGCMVVGEVAALATRPLTDKVVAGSFRRVRDFRTNRKLKKAEKDIQKDEK